MHGLSCSAACGVFPDQGSNPCPLHWQADLNHCATREALSDHPLFLSRSHSVLATLASLLFPTYASHAPILRFFPPTPSSSPTPAGCPPIQVNSDTTYLERASDPTGKGSVPQDRPPTPHFRLQSQVQVVTCASDQQAIDGRFPRTPPPCVQLIC